MPCLLLRFLFLTWTTRNIKVPLILRVGRKWKGLAGDNYKSTPNIEFEQDWSFTLGVTLGTDRKLKNIILLTKIFSGNADSAILLRFECAINPQNFIKIGGAIFEKIKIFNILSCELSLILGIGGKLKKGSRYLQEVPRYRIWTRSVDWFRLYDRRRSDRQTDTHTHRHFF